MNKAFKALQLNQLLLASIILLSATNLAIATTETPAQMDSQNKHMLEPSDNVEQGLASLMLATGVDQLEIMLSSPALTLLGLDREPETDAEAKVLKQAQRKLEAGETLFEINPEAACNLSSVQVDSSLLDNERSQGRLDAKPTDKELTSGHSEVDVSWSFTCAKPEALKSLTTQLFSNFPDNLRKLRVEWVTESQESSKELLKDETIMLTVD